MRKRMDIETRLPGVFGWKPECVRTGMEQEVEAVRAAPGASPAMALAPLTQDHENHHAR